MTYPQFYLDGNISLQNTIESFEKLVKRDGIKFLIASVFFWAALLVGVVFEFPFLIFLGVGENIVCGWFFYRLFDGVHEQNIWIT